MQDLLEKTINDAEAIIIQFNSDENKAYIMLPDLVSQIEKIFITVLPIFSEEPVENAGWINGINYAIESISIGMNQRDTIKVMDSLECEILPLLVGILRIF